MSMRFTVLVISANPERHNLRLDAEQRAMTEAVDRSERQRQRLPSGAEGAVGHIEFVRVGAARLRDLSRMLVLHRPQAVHFSGHGAENGALVFETEAGGRAPVPPDILANVLSPFQPSLRLVLLNACYSHVQATRLARTIDCCIGMTTAVEDPDALLFARAFYDLAALGCSVHESFALAVQELTLAGSTPQSGAAPCLMTRPGVDAKQVFLNAPPSASSVGDGPGLGSGSKDAQLPIDAPPSLRRLASQPLGQLTPGLLRRAINDLLLSDAAVGAFLQGMYPRSAREVSDNMQRSTKINLLFTYEPNLPRLRSNLIRFVCEQAELDSQNASRPAAD